MRKTTIKANKIIAIVIGILCLAIFGAGTRPHKNQVPTSKFADQASPNKPLLVLRMKQPGSPLTIRDMTVDDSADPLMPLIQCNVKNRSQKPILLYALKHEAIFTKRTGTFSGSVTSIPADSNYPMHPGDTRQVEIYGINYGEMPENITLSVDFVEFIDGTRWGPDTLKNSDRLDGTRAGAQAEREALMKVLMTEGSEGVIRALDSIEPKADQPSSRSAEWLDGFRHGVGWIRGRVRSKGQDHSEIEKALRRPVHSTEDRSKSK